MPEQIGVDQSRSQRSAADHPYVNDGIQSRASAQRLGVLAARAISSATNEPREQPSPLTGKVTYHRRLVGARCGSKTRLSDPSFCGEIRHRLTLSVCGLYLSTAMKTVTVRDLRNSFSKLEAWLLEGEEIRIEKRGQPIGVLTAWRTDAAEHPAKPDFAARRRAIWGNRVFTDAEVAAMRADELEGEEG